MADLFWLSDAQWAVIAPFHAESTSADPSAGTTGMIHCRASYTCSPRAAAGATARPIMVRAPRSTTPVQQVVPARLLAGDAGRPGQGRVGRATRRPSTAATSRRTACAHGGKGGRERRPSGRRVRTGPSPSLCRLSKHPAMRSRRSPLLSRPSPLGEPRLPRPQSCPSSWRVSAGPPNCGRSAAPGLCNPRGRHLPLPLQMLTPPHTQGADETLPAVQSGR